MSQASTGDYDALVLPGGTLNPDTLRMDRAAVAFVRDSWSARPSSTRSRQPVGGPVLLTADVEASAVRLLIQGERTEKERLRDRGMPAGPRP